METVRPMVSTKSIPFELIERAAVRRWLQVNVRNPIRDDEDRLFKLLRKRPLKASLYGIQIHFVRQQSVFPNINTIQPESVFKVSFVTVPEKY